MSGGKDAAHGFREKILPHLDAAHSLALWLARDPALAEDIAQDACLRALKYFASFDGGDARAWLLRIVRNTAYSALAARRGKGEVPLGGGAEDDRDGAGMDVPDPGPSPEAALSSRQDLARLDEALAALPIELRECLVLRELETMSYGEIAAVTQVPIGTVMSRLWRARRMLTRGRPEGSQA